MYLGPVGGILPDHGGGGHTGVFYSPMSHDSWTTYKGEPAIKFSSADFTGRVQIPTSFKMGGLTELSCHYRFNEVSNPGAMRSLIRKDLQVTLAQFDTSELRCVFWAPSLAANGNQSYSYDTWNNVVITWKNFSIEIWLNGAKVQTVLNGSAGLAADNDSYPLVFGGTESGNELFDGYMQTVTIWQRKLSDNEVHLLSRNPYAVSERTRKRYFRSAVTGRRRRVLLTGS